MAGLPDVARLVDVVGVGQQGEACPVGEAEGEGAAQPAALGARGGLHVADVAAAVLLLQVDVHHVLARFDVVAQRLAHVRLLFIDFQVLDGVVGQVLHQHALVAAEECARTQQQLIDLAAVDEDLAVVVHRHARQLADEVVEHRAFGHAEGGGVVDERVATVEELDFRGCHGDLVERHVAHAEHLYGGHLHFVLPGVGDGCTLPDVVVAVQPGVKKVFLALGLYVGHEMGVFYPHTRPEDLYYGQGVHEDGAVGGVQRHVGLGQGHIEETVPYLAHQPDSLGQLELLLRGLYADGLSLYLHLHGQPLAHLPDGSRDALPLHACRSGEVVQSVGKDVDGIVGLSVTDGLQRLDEGRFVKVVGDGLLRRCVRDVK